MEVSALNLMQYNQLVTNARLTKSIRVTRREFAAARSYRERDVSLDVSLTRLLRSASHSVTLRERALIALMSECPGELAWQVGVAGISAGVLTIAVSHPSVSLRLRPAAERIRRDLGLTVRFQVDPAALRRPRHGGPPPAEPARPSPPPRTRLVNRRRVPAATALF